MRITLFENSLITAGGHELAGQEDGTAVPDGTFAALRQLALGTTDTDALLTLTVRKGREVVRFRNYAGLLQLADGTQIEILPKIDQPAEARTALLTMLRCLRNSPFRTLNARTGTARLPLWDVFITAFLDALEPLLHQGLQRSYRVEERNERFWKGQFQPARQQRENQHHAERLAVRYEFLTTDVPPNRILKTALLYVNKRTASVPNQQRIGRALVALADVPPSESVAPDEAATRRVSRLFARYEPALRWAAALLNQQLPGVRAGSVVGQSLLFPMERVFEEFVAQGVRRYWPADGVVTVQESSAHLVDEHVGTPKFKLRPDILIRQEGKTFVLDTKWKQLDGQQKTGNYGIEQADLYQLYAYGKKYVATDLFLIYPTNDTFQKPLSVFGYDATTRLHVVPFSCTQPLPSEVEKLARYALEQ